MMDQDKIVFEEKPEGLKNNYEIHRKWLEV